MKKYEVKKHFISGYLTGITVTEHTDVSFPVGYVCEHPSCGGSGYIILACREV